VHKARDLRLGGKPVRSSRWPIDVAWDSSHTLRAHSGATYGASGWRGLTGGRGETFATTFSHSVGVASFPPSGGFKEETKT